MAGIEDLLKGKVADLLKNELAGGAAIGVAAAVLVPLALPLLGKTLRPVAKGAIKAGFIALEKGRESVAELGELVEDAIAEARAELDQGHYAVPAAAAAAAEPEPAGPAGTGRGGAG